MVNQFSRIELIFGKDGMERLFTAKVAVFGIGGVSGYAVEALARSGIGRIDLFDDDKVCLTNINRQIHATRKTVGKYKVDVACERILDINPETEVHAHKLFYTPETSIEVDLSQYDYVIDAIDTMSGKLALVMKAKEADVPIICSMGAENKVDPTAFEVTDIYKLPFVRLRKNAL
jgi:tRNA A37 threonylcarbamoyladenosine dehydratase